MKKQLLMKTFLVAVCMLVGTSVAWADATTVYERGYVTNWSSSDIGSGNWGGNAYYQEGEGIKLSGNGGRSTSKTFSFTEYSLLTIDFVFNTGNNTGNAGNYTTYGIGDDIQIWFNQQNQQGKVIINGNENTISNACVKDQNRNNDLWTVHMEIDSYKDQLTAMTLSGRDGTNKASFTLSEAVNLSHDVTTSITASINIYRAKGDLNTYLSSMKIQQEAQAVPNADYTINYQLNSTTVKSVAGTSVVGATITALTAVDGEETYEGKHYLITSAEAPSMKLVANAANNVLNVPVRAPYTATLKITRNVGGVAQEPVETKLTETDSKVCAWDYTYPMYLKQNGVYYVADNVATFGESGTFTDGQVINKTIAYTSPDYSVVYFGEPNESAGTNTAYSNGSTGYITGGVKYDNNSVIRLGTLPAGDYRLITNVTGSAQRNVVVGDCSDTSVFPTALVTITTTGVKDEPFTIAAATPISISGKDQGSGKFNQSADIDYILVKVSNQKTTIPTSGYGTIASAYALDCAKLPDDLKAYKVSELTTTTVTLAEVTEAVAANTGLILKGTAGQTYDIPVAATGTDISATNKLKAAVTATDIAANKAYILQGGLFHLVNAASSIPAGKAYLLASDIPSGARSLNFTFDATAIKAVEGEIQNGEFYNVAGQRVAQPTKGLYIVNGKKIVVK